MQTWSEKLATILVQSVHQNYEGYTKREVLEAKKARRAMVLIGNPSETNFKGMVSNSMIANSPVTTTAITTAHTIFGPDLASMRGKTMQLAPAPVVADYVAVSKRVIKRNKTVTLAPNVFSVNGVAFLVTVSRNIKVLTAKHAVTRTAKSLTLSCLGREKNLAKKSRKWRSHNPPPTQRIAIFGRTTHRPVIKIGTLSRKSSAEAAAVAAVQ